MALTGREMTEAARQAVSKIPNDQLQSQLATGASVVVLDARILPVGVFFRILIRLVGGDFAGNLTSDALLHSSRVIKEAAELIIKNFNDV